MKNSQSTTTCKGSWRLRWAALYLGLALLLPTSVQAAVIPEGLSDLGSVLVYAPADTATVALQAAGVAFKVVHEDNAYAVYARPNVTPDGQGYTYTAQVTVKVPHGVGDDRFEVANLQPAVNGLIWAQLSRIDAPTEDPASDYISFELNPTLSQLDAIDWQAEQEVKLFTFEGGGTTNVVGLVSNCDRFLAPNSAGTNPGNQIAIQGVDIDNAYIGNYDIVVDTNICDNGVFMPIIIK